MAFIFKITSWGTPDLKAPLTNPFGDFRQECKNVMQRYFNKAFPNLLLPSFRFVLPPNDEYGDLSSSICFELAKLIKNNPKILAEQIIKNMDLSGTSLIRKVEFAGGGYINYYLDYSKFSQLTIKSARILCDSYGFIKIKSPKKIIVEHTSVNPTGPIHVGTARNSFLGDSLCRILKARGHKVNANFYIDDVGRQTAILAYGYKLISKDFPITTKIDHWLGLVYAITSSIIEIKILKQQLQKLKRSGMSTKQVQAELDGWISAAADLCERDASLFYELLDKINKDKNCNLSISRIMQAYERENLETKDLVRKIVELCLSGFKETYNQVNIKWDSWDWESGLVWDGSVTEVIKKLELTPYCNLVEGALEFDVERAVKEKKLKNLFGIPEEHKIPPLILKRSDGTTLYSTRDIAYSLQKLSKADTVINIIGTEQSLTQTQLKIALHFLTSQKKVTNLIHYDYELVKIPGYKMSKRRGRYITLDEILDEAKKRALEEVEKRSSYLPNNTKNAIAEAVGSGAIKYALVSIAPTKQVIFDWKNILNFELNSAPFIQYSYARASNILKKAGRISNKIDYSLLKHKTEHELIRKVALFPEVFVDAANKLSPNSLAEFTNELAANFNSFYACVPVLHAESLELRASRLALVDAVRITIRNALGLLGIDVMERM